MDDRRRETRNKFMAFTPVFDQERGIVLGYLGNLTMKGAMLIGEKSLEVNATATLHIEFLDELPGGLARRLVIPSRVARCVHDEESAHDYNIGFEFINTTPEQDQIIEAMLDTYHFRYREWTKGKE